MYIKVEDYKEIPKSLLMQNLYNFFRACGKPRADIREVDMGAIEEEAYQRGYNQSRIDNSVLPK